MKISEQDRYYLEVEGDSFFERLKKGKDLSQLRVNKATIYDAIKDSEIEYDNVLEYGCNYGDLLNQMIVDQSATTCIGVEASIKAVEFGREKFADNIDLMQGTIASNAVNDQKKYENFFDLVIVEDVLGWVSRETILQSIANIDSVLKEGGYVFLRDFYPDKRVMNRNHHVADATLYNFKVPGSHASIFEATGSYEIQWQKIYFDNIGMSTDYKCDNEFNYRWTDVILRKSTTSYFNESKQL